MLKIFDIRMNKFLTPISFPTGPAIVKFHPKYPTTLVTIAHNGDFLIGDVNDAIHRRDQVTPTTPSGFITSLSFSSSGDVLAIGDSYGILQLWTQREAARINAFSNPSLQATISGKGPVIEFNNDM